MDYSFVTNNGVRRLNVVTEAGDVWTIPGAHPNFDAIHQALVLDEPETTIKGLYGWATDVQHQLRRLSERVSYANGELRFDEDRLDNALTRHIVSKLRAEDNDWERFVRFLENLAVNPSRQSRHHLFRWLNDREFTVTNDGCFIAYKGVGSDHRSVHSGHAMVNGEPVTGRIPNEPGSVITMPRSQVNPNRDTGCSTGLHAGSFEYASSFGPTTATVKINPRDVVAVPRDCAYQKLRVCRYEVLNVHAVQHETPSWDDDETYDEDDETYDVDSPS